MDDKLPELSLFFPAFNEAGNIEESVKQALLVLPQVARKFEVIIVNDGSSDATLPIAERLAAKYSQVKVVSQKNKGYGGALKAGFKEAKYEWVFLTDADLQFSLQELKKFVPQTKYNDLVVGFRQNRAEGWKRQFLAQGLRLWNLIFFGFPLKIKDIDCAFKLVHRPVLREVSPLIADSAMVSTELLLKAIRAGFSYTQVGVKHYQRVFGQPTGNNWQVILRAIKDTFVLKSYFWDQSARIPAKRLKYSWQIVQAGLALLFE